MMHVLQAAPSHSANIPSQQALVAIVYADEVYPQSIFEMIVEQCREQGLSPAGVLQHSICSDRAGHCDVALEDLSTGVRTNIFEDRGPGASGCRLDEAALADVTGRLARSLEAKPDILILNKFGKVEAEGRGLLDLVALAVDRSIPVVIGVPSRNLAAWRKFAGGMSVELSNNATAVSDWLGKAFPNSATQGAVQASC